MKYKTISNPCGYGAEELDSSYGSAYLYEFFIWWDNTTQGRTAEEFAHDLAKYSAGKSARQVYKETVNCDEGGGYCYPVCKRLARKDIAKMDPETRREAAIEYEKARKSDDRWLKRFRQALEAELAK